MDAAAPFPLSAASERIAAVIFGLCQTLSARARATLTPAQLTYIVGRLLTIRKRFRRLAERICAGQPPRERTRKPRAKPPAPDPEFPLGFRPPPRGWRRWAVISAAPVPLWRSLRQRFAWLLPLAPSAYGFSGSAAAHREELSRLLAEPETRALLQASRRVGDSLRPLCWMLGIDTALLYPARPAAAVPSAVLAPEPSAPGAGSADPVAAMSGVNPPPDGGGIRVRASPGAGAVEPPGEPPRAPTGVDFFATA